MSLNYLFHDNLFAVNDVDTCWQFLRGRCVETHTKDGVDALLGGCCNDVIDAGGGAFEAERSYGHCGWHFEVGAVGLYVDVASVRAVESENAVIGAGEDIALNTACSFDSGVCRYALQEVFSMVLVAASSVL